MPEWNKLLELLSKSPLLSNYILKNKWMLLGGMQIKKYSWLFMIRNLCNYIYINQNVIYQ
jgi:hypothetical protein